MSCFKIINLETSSKRLSNPFPYIQKIWCLIHLKYVHLLLYLKTFPRKGKTQFTVISYSFSCLPISSIAMVAFLPAIFGEKEVCFKSTSQ